MTPRLGPVRPADQSDEQRELLAAVGGDDALNIFTTLVRHPGLYRRWLPFGGKLLQGSRLSPRDRELIILRVAILCGARYEWAQHVPMAREAGLTDDEIRRVGAGLDAVGWSPTDAALISAVDEVTLDHRITDATWASLSDRYDEKQLIEVPMLAGHYALLAGVLNSFGVEVEHPDQPTLGAV